MDYLIEYDTENEIVRVTVQGEIDVEGAIAIMLKAVAFGREKGCNRFLFDQRQSHANVIFFKHFKMMANLQRLGLKRTDRAVALVARQMGIHAFAETVAVNRGWQVKLITDDDEAIKWLLKKI